ncbi:MAG: hypothetical protein NTU95_04760 [Methanothrix sp.]|nr:hypothetical protein [Methanothrix sp.]
MILNSKKNALRCMEESDTLFESALLAQEILQKPRGSAGTVSGASRMS